MDWIWKSIFLTLFGMILLRIAGRKSISQMSVAQTVIMISIGSIIIQPIADHHMGIEIGSAAIFIAVLLLIEYLQVKFEWIEKLMVGSAITVIDNGQIQHKELKKLRLTVDQLETRLRRLGISQISDVRTATIESDGELGYELVPQAKPVTLGDLEKLLGAKNLTVSSQKDPLFQEVNQNGNSSPVDPRLQ